MTLLEKIVHAAKISSLIIGIFTICVLMILFIIFGINMALRPEYSIFDVLEGISIVIASAFIGIFSIVIMVECIE